MELLKLLFNLVVIAFALWLLYYVVGFSYYIIGGILYCLWVGLFAVAAVVGAAILWHQGSDNFAVLMLIAGLIGEGVWWGKWAMKNNPVLWVHRELSSVYKTIENAIKDVLKRLRLRKPDPHEECPQCGSRNIKLIKKWTATYESTGTFTRTIKHYSEDGTETGHSEEEYEAPTTETVSYRDMACAQCSNTWTNR